MRFNQTQVITFANQKGGCGKTSSSVSVAAAFAKLGYDAAIVDCDPQCNATESFGLEVDKLQKEGKYSLLDAFLAKRPATDIAQVFEGRFPGKLAVIPGNRSLSAVDKRLESTLQAQIAEPGFSPLDADEISDEHRKRLKKSIDSLRGKYDVVIMDTGPSLDFIMVSALIAADWFVIPVFPSGYDLQGLQILMKTVAKVRAKINPGLRLAGVLLGNFDKSTALDRDTFELLKKRFGEGVVFDTVIYRSVKHREATNYRHPIFEHEGAGEQAENYINLVKEMIKRASGVSVTPLPDEDAMARVANG